MSSAPPSPTAVAFTPDARTRESADVPTPTVDDLQLAPIPVGLSLSAVDDDGSNPREIPLYYVSESAASLRDWQRHPHNGTGVVPGWYACASPGRFKIHVVPIADTLKDYNRDIKADVYVNGELHIKHIHWKPRSLALGNSFTLDDWETTTGASDGWIQEVREPLLIKPSPRGEKPGEEGLGTIKLRVGSCDRVVHTRPCMKGTPYKPKQEDDADKDLSNEKMGRTLSVERGSPKRNEVRGSIVRTPGYKTFDHGTVCVYLCERWWLRSRRIIDDRMNAVTAIMFRTIRRLDSLRICPDAFDQFGQDVGDPGFIIDLDALGNADEHSEQVENPTKVMRHFIDLTYDNDHVGSDYAGSLPAKREAHKGYS